MAINDIGKSVSSIVGSRTFAFTNSNVGGKSLQASADLLSALNTNVSVGFIPIFSESVNVDRNVDVSAIMLADVTTGKKEYITDNTAPQPRVWSVSGYIKNLVPVLESVLVVKPTLLLQKWLLDYYAQKRTTIPFRDEAGDIIEVVIKQVSFSYDAKATNAYSVRLVLQEAVTIQNVAGELPKSAASGVAATSSVPSQIRNNIGALIARQVISGITYPGSIGMDLLINILNEDSEYAQQRLQELEQRIADIKDTMTQEREEVRLDIPDNYTLSALPSIDNDGEEEFNGTLTVEDFTYTLQGYYETEILSANYGHWIFVLTNTETDEQQTVVLNTDCRYELTDNVALFCENPTVDSSITVDNLPQMQFFIIRKGA